MTSFLAMNISTSSRLIYRQASISRQVSHACVFLFPYNVWYNQIGWNLLKKSYMISNLIIPEWCWIILLSVHSLQRVDCIVLFACLHFVGKFIRFCFRMQEASLGGVTKILWGVWPQRRALQIHMRREASFRLFIQWPQPRAYRSERFCWAIIQVTVTDTYGMASTRCLS